MAHLERPGPPIGRQQHGRSHRPDRLPSPRLASADRTASLPRAKQGPGLVVAPIEQESEPKKGAGKMLVRMAWRVVGLTIKSLDPGLNNLGLPKIVFDKNFYILTLTMSEKDTFKFGTFLLDM